MEKYKTLVKILDGLSSEAPQAYSKYHSTEIDDIVKIRSKCYIHLYLKVTFGLLNFNDREGYITDESYDGGIDAYYIDKEDKIIYYIQSKFRNKKQIL